MHHQELRKKNFFILVFVLMELLYLLYFFNGELLPFTVKSTFYLLFVNVLAPHLA